MKPEDRIYVFNYSHLYIYTLARLCVRVARFCSIDFEKHGLVTTFYEQGLSQFRGGADFKNMNVNIYIPHKEYAKKFTPLDYNDILIRILLHEYFHIWDIGLWHRYCGIYNNPGYTGDLNQLPEEIRANTFCNKMSKIFIGLNLDIHKELYCDIAKNYY